MQMNHFPRGFWAMILSSLLLLGLLASHVLGNFEVQPAAPPAAHVLNGGVTSTGVRILPLPIRLLIPAIGVNAPVEALGTLPNGDLQVPIQHPWEDVGWYQDGPVPGQVGSAVIDGHMDRPGELPAVFWNLHRLHMRDWIQIVLADGSSVSFRVTQVSTYPPTTMPLSRIFEDTSGTYLNLITCAGIWIPSQQQTSLRLVVYSVLSAPEYLLP
jgi:sortase (surface protein transpeptidase)